MEEQKFNQAKELLENFNHVDETVQNKLLNGVKCLAFLYDLTDETKDDADEKLSVQPA